MLAAPVLPLKARLDELLRTYDRERHRAADPVSFVHRHADDADREVVGLLASSLAFGNVKAVRASVERVLVELGPRPAAAIEAATERELRRRLRRFVHRTWTGDDVAHLLARAAMVRREEGSLGRAFAARLARSPGLQPGLASFAAELRGSARGRGIRHLVPDPEAGSACKRLVLYLRWMVRRADGIDLGLWPIDPSVLIMPVDTHILRIGKNLGLTARNDASWRTAEEMTASLRRFDPEDPVKYDFALCHLGISRACPSRPDPALCASCVLRSVCVQWAPPRARSTRPPGDASSRTAPAPSRAAPRGNAARRSDRRAPPPPEPAPGAALARPRDTRSTAPDRRSRAAPLSRG
jgi:uncharacterized protein (TIGR02757 family)